MSPFYDFQSYFNTYDTKLRGTPQKTPLWHQKMDCLMCNYPLVVGYYTYEQVPVLNPIATNLEVEHNQL